MSVSEKAGRTVVFYATDIHTAKTVYHKPIVFNTVKVNEGGCYDDTTGVFTTSVPGTYVFTAAVGSEKEDRGVPASRWMALPTPRSMVPSRPRAAAVCRYSWGWDRGCG